MPLLSSFVIIYFGLFILHIYGLYYSSVSIKLSTVFGLYNPITSFSYATSIILVIITLIVYFFKHDSEILIPFMLILDVGLIQLTSIFLIINKFFNYQFWFSYQLLLALIIVGLAYFSLAQYTSAVRARAKLTEYKNALSITRARLDHIIINKKDYDIKNLSDIYTKLKIEFSSLEKPKLLYMSWLPPLLDVYSTLDMKEEAEIYFDNETKTMNNK